jgi:hypothetical protein
MPPTDELLKGAGPRDTSTGLLRVGPPHYFPGRTCGRSEACLDLGRDSLRITSFGDQAVIPEMVVGQHGPTNSIFD